MIERKALIFNIQKYNTYDGPGVRTLVFFKGCPLRCCWCSNPEGQLRQYEVLFKKDQCTHCGACIAACPAGVHRWSSDRQNHEIARAVECVGCRRCEAACISGALAVVGELKTISELLAIIEEDKPFYDASGGGVTLGGGEMLMQPEVAVNLLMACKQRGINTAVETCGYARQETVIKVAGFTDLFLFDVKHMDSERHYRLAGVHNERILSNLGWLLENKHRVRVRMPLLKGINDDNEGLDRLVRFLSPFQDFGNFEGVDLLPYHKMGVGKYRQLDKEYVVEGDPRLDEADMENIERRIGRHGFLVSVIRH